MITYILIYILLNMIIFIIIKQIIFEHSTACLLIFSNTKSGVLIYFSCYKLPPYDTSKKLFQSWARYTHFGLIIFYFIFNGYDLISVKEVNHCVILSLLPYNSKQCCFNFREILFCHLRLKMKVRGS